MKQYESHPESINDYLHSQSGLSLRYVEREFEEADETPVSFNQFTDNIGYIEHNVHTHQVIIKGFKYIGKGFSVSGYLPEPVMLSETVTVDGQEHDYTYNDDELTEAIYEAIGPCNRELIDIV